MELDEKLCEKKFSKRKFECANVQNYLNFYEKFICNFYDI